ncbi:MAG: carboxypeptidase-like regulatory domain-containing protein [Bacteroidetes bacterium]|nr:carboxypeptidase-like regulatory domain-containing protein [Bacteroidota bacterium]
MKKIELKLRKSLRFLFGCFSFTAIAFIFQACYGPGPDCSYSIKLTGRVTSKSTNAPIQGIKVRVAQDRAYGITDENGNFDFYASIAECRYYRYGDDCEFEDTAKLNTLTYDEALIYFRDIDGAANGHFADTAIIVKPARKNELRINIELVEKQ